MRCCCGPFRLGNRLTSNGRNGWPSWKTAVTRGRTIGCPFRRLGGGAIRKAGARRSTGSDRDGRWTTMTLHGERAISTPVTHVSWYEADAFARGGRASVCPPNSNRPRPRTIRSWCKSRRRNRSAAAGAARAARAWMNSCSAMCGSGPRRRTGVPSGFAPTEGTASEQRQTSGQTMAGVAWVRSPPGHIRATYRNSSYPAQRWQFKWACAWPKTSMRRNLRRRALATTVAPDHDFHGASRRFVPPRQGRVAQVVLRRGRLAPVRGDHHPRRVLSGLRNRVAGAHPANQPAQIPDRQRALVEPCRPAPRRDWCSMRLRRSRPMFPSTSASRRSAKRLSVSATPIRRWRSSRWPAISPRR